MLFCENLGLFCLYVCMRGNDMMLVNVIKIILEDNLYWRNFLGYWRWWDMFIVNLIEYLGCVGFIKFSCKVVYGCFRNVSFF